MGISADEQGANHSSRCHHPIEIIVASPWDRSLTKVSVACRKQGHEQGASDEVGNVTYHHGDYERAARLCEQARTIAIEFRCTFGCGLAGLRSGGRLARRETSATVGRCQKRARPGEDEKLVTKEWGGMAETNAPDLRWSEINTALLLLPCCCYSPISPWIQDQHHLRLGCK